IDDCLENCRTRRNHQPGELISFSHPDVPRSMEGDSARLRQMIMSLLNNANANSEEGGILLAAAADEQADGSQSLRLVGQEPGPPLRAEPRASPLEAAAPTGLLVDMRERQGQLSLYISQQLVRLMGAQTGIKESSEQGNSIWITLPAEL